LLGASKTPASVRADRPTIGYFDPPAGPVEERLEKPWELSKEEWTGIIGRVRAGRTLKPKNWPNRSRFAVAFSFDCDHEVAVLAGGNTSPGRLAWGQRGRRVGVPRILDVLRRHDVPASFYIPAVAALLDENET